VSVLLTPERVREMLGVRYCKTCRQDAMILDSGYCPWCLRDPVTGELDFAAAIKDREDRRRARMARNAKQYRERVKARACLNCGDLIQPHRAAGRPRKFCSGSCTNDWWRKRQNAERAA
jgi:hypothetical protein